MTAQFQVDKRTMRDAAKWQHMSWSRRALKRAMNPARADQMENAAALVALLQSGVRPATAGPRPFRLSWWLGQ